MGFFSGVRRVVKPLVNFPRWMDLTRLGEFGSMIKDSATRVFTPTKATREENFTEAMRRLQLTDADLQNRKQEFTRLMIVFLILSLVIFAYTLYLFSQSYLRGGIVAFVVSCIALTQSFRFHFWLFQIKQRKLGCTLKEWLVHGLLGRSR